MAANSWRARYTTSVLLPKIKWVTGSWSISAEVDQPTKDFQIKRVAHMKEESIKVYYVQKLSQNFIFKLRAMLL